jgi:hypothetical protein
MLLLILSAACAGLFCGAALYVNFVEHPARMSCGPELALREFAPSYQRATTMQASLAIGGLILGLVSAWQLRDPWVAVGALLLGASVPFTLIVLFPVNGQSIRHSTRTILELRACCAAGINCTPSGPSSAPRHSEPCFVA